MFKYPQSDYSRGELVFASSWPTWAWTGLALLAVCGITVLLARHYRRGVSWQLASVWLLQITMLGIALFVFLQPALRFVELRPGVNTLALVLDASASMAIAADGRARVDIAREQLESATAVAASNGLDISRYLLGSAATAVGSFSNVAATASDTAIADSLQSVLSEGQTRSLAAVLLVSDGIDTAGNLTAARLAELAAAGVPIHTLAVGRESMPEDLELTRVSLPTRALQSSTMTARATIRHDAAGTARINVYDGDALVQSVPVNLPGDVQSTSAAIDIPVDQAGYHRLQFVLESDGGETELRNNRQSTLVQVAADDFRILYYEGEPRWEYKFMRRALGPSGDISLVSLLQVSPNKYYRQGIESPEQLADGFPVTRDELFAYDALIIGSVAAATLSTVQLQNIHAFVSERGGSLLMLAGRNGLGDGGWGQSAIADLLPVSLPPSTGISFVREKAHVSLTPQGSNYSPLRLASDDEENRTAWDGLPEIADYQRTAGLKPAARTLLTARTDSDELPLLIMQPYGRGHSFVLATGGTWRWQMSLPVEDDRHERFWRQLLRALVSGAPSRTSVAVEFTGGTSVEIRAEVRDQAFDPVADVRVSAIASHENGASQLVELLPDNAMPGMFSGDFTPDAAGNWYVEAIARSGDETTAVMRTGIYVEPESREYFNVRSNPALLRRVSEATGGRFFTASSLATLPEVLRYASAGISETTDRPVWDAPAWFLLLFATKAGEWLLRRRWRTI